MICTVVYLKCICKLPNYSNFIQFSESFTKDSYLTHNKCPVQFTLRSLPCVYSSVNRLYADGILKDAKLCHDLAKWNSYEIYDKSTESI